MNYQWKAHAETHVIKTSIIVEPFAISEESSTYTKSCKHSKVRMHHC